MTRQQKGVFSFVALAAMIIGTTHAPAAEAASNCAQSRILAGQSHRLYRGLSWRLNPRKGMEMLVGGKPYFMGSPESCDLDGPSHEELSSGNIEDLDYSCIWDFSDRTKARQFYDRILQEMEKCLSADLEKEESNQYSGGLLDIASTSWEYAKRHYSVSGEIDLTGFAKDVQNPPEGEDWEPEHYWVQLELYYYQNDQ